MKTPSHTQLVFIFENRKTSWWYVMRESLLCPRKFTVIVFAPPSDESMKQSLIIYYAPGRVKKHKSACEKKRGQHPSSAVDLF